MYVNDDRMGFEQFLWLFKCICPWRCCYEMHKSADTFKSVQWKDGMKNGHGYQLILWEVHRRLGFCTLPISMNTAMAVFLLLSLPIIYSRLLGKNIPSRIFELCIVIVLIHIFLYQFHIKKWFTCTCNISHTLCTILGSSHSVNISPRPL
jgi:hypothetical protein